jgi:hypothetical protein
LQHRRRKWLVPESRSFEQFGPFVVRMLVALAGVVALWRWALGGDVSDVGAIAGIVSVAVGGAFARHRDGRPR